MEKIFIIRSDRLENNIKMTTMARFITTYEATCTLTGLLNEILAKNRFFGLALR